MGTEERAILAEAAAQAERDAAGPEGAAAAAAGGAPGPTGPGGPAAPEGNGHGDEAAAAAAAAAGSNAAPEPGSDVDMEEEVGGGGGVARRGGCCGGGWGIAATLCRVKYGKGRRGGGACARCGSAGCCCPAALARVHPRADPSILAHTLAPRTRTRSRSCCSKPCAQSCCRCTRAPQPCAPPHRRHSTHHTTTTTPALLAQDDGPGGQIRVVHNYSRQDRAAAANKGYDPAKFVVSPITGGWVGGCPAWPGLALHAWPGPAWPRDARVVATADAAAAADRSGLKGGLSASAPAAGSLACTHTGHARPNPNPKP